MLDMFLEHSSPKKSAQFCVLVLFLEFFLPLVSAYIGIRSRPGGGAAADRLFRGTAFSTPTKLPQIGTPPARGPNMVLLATLPKGPAQVM